MSLKGVGGCRCLGRGASRAGVVKPTAGLGTAEDYRMSCRFALSIFIWAGLIIAPSTTVAEELVFNTQNFPPYHYRQNDTILGPAVDIVQRVCEEADLECSIRLLPWPRAQMEVEKGRADGLFLIGWNEDRAKQLYFSYPILQSSYGFFVHSNNPLEYRSLLDISGYRVAVYGPSNTSASLENIRKRMAEAGLLPIEIDMTHNGEAGFHKLSLQRVGAVYSNFDTGNALISRLGLGNVRYAGRVESLRYYVGFSRSQVKKSAVDRFNAALYRVHLEGEVRRILERYGVEVVEAEDLVIP